MGLNLNKKFLLTAIIPIQPRPSDLRNVFNWIESDISHAIHYVLVLDRPTEEITKLMADFLGANHEGNRVDVNIGNFFGPGNARNAGLTYIDTPFVAFWDSDDWPHIPTILKFVANLDANASKLYVAAFNVEYAAKEAKLVTTSNLLEMAMNPGIWRCIFPSNLVRNCAFPDTQLGEDQVFLAQVISLCEEIEFSKEVFYSYNFGQPNQLTKVTDFSHLTYSQILLSRIDLTNAKESHREFVENLEIKQLATMLSRGSTKVRSIAILRLCKKVAQNRTRGLSAVAKMLRIREAERINE